MAVLARLKPPDCQALQIKPRHYRAAMAFDTGPGLA
jgi:hypothetical protein